MEPGKSEEKDEDTREVTSPMDIWGRHVLKVVRVDSELACVTMYDGKVLYLDVDTVLQDWLYLHRKSRVV